jgi:branched-chain amino acid transport system substrate-binding protein
VIIGAPKRRSGANPGGVPPGFVCQDERVFGAEDTWSMFQSGGTTQLVMAGLVPAIHAPGLVVAWTVALLARGQALLVARKTWMPAQLGFAQLRHSSEWQVGHVRLAGTRPGMTVERSCVNRATPTRRRLRPALLTPALLVLLAVSAHAQISDDAVRIGVLNDQSNGYADLGGVGSVEAARMAVEDFGGKVLGKPIELLSADHQQKADIGAGIARRWFDVAGVDMAIDFDNSSVALAVEQLAREHNRVAIATAVATPDFTGKACSPTAVAWTYDSYALTTGIAKSLVKRGLDSWFFITVDYAFGHSLEADASNAVLASGGKVVGRVRHPLGAADFSSYLLQAQSSKAKVIAFANTGSDLTNAIKQAAEFGLTGGEATLVPLLVFISDVNSLGLQMAQGLTFITPFYWDMNDQTRAWSKRFFERRKVMPTMAHASVYSAIIHYLKAVQAAGTDEAKAVVARMREMPVDDFYTRNGRVREDGRMIHDMYVVQAKTPAESKYPWDYYKVLQTIPGDQIFRSLEDGGCPLVNKASPPK